MENDLDIMYHRNRKDQLDYIMKQWKKSGNSPYDINVDDYGNQADIMRRIVENQWGNDSPQKKAAPVVVEKSRVIVRDLLIDAITVSHKTSTVKIRFTHRVNKDKKVHLKLPINSPYLKNMSYSEVYDVYGDVKIEKDGTRITFTKFGKLTSL